MLFILFAFQRIEAQYVSVNSGNWNDDNTWSGTGIPGLGNSVTIDHTIDLTADAECGSLIINGTLRIHNQTLTVPGDLHLGGGSVIMESGFLYIGDDQITIAGGSFNWGTGTVIFNRNGNQEIPGPTNYHHMIIAGSGIKTPTGAMAPNITLSGNLTVQNGTTLQLTIYNLTVTGTTTNYGQILDNSNTGTDVFIGKIINETTGTWNTESVSISNRLHFRGGIDQKNMGVNSFRLGGARFTASSQEISGSGSISYANSCIIGTPGITVTNNNTGIITIYDIFDGVTAVGNASWIAGEGSTIVYARSSITPPFVETGMTLNLTAHTNTFIYGRSGNQNVKAISYNNIEFSNGGTKTLLGHTLVTGNLDINATTTLNGATFNLSVAGNWNDEGGFSGASGRVIFNGIADQNITKSAQPEYFNNLEVNKPSGTLSLNDNVTVTSLFAMTAGTISTNSSDLFMSNSTFSNLSYTSGRIIGKFGRAIGTTGVSYLFPIGSLSNYNGIQITFNNLSNGQLFTEFVTGDPGDNGLPLPDGASDTIFRQFPEGYWNLFASATPPLLASNNFNIALAANGFNAFPLDAETRIMYRNGISDWTVSGTHGSNVPPVIHRNNFSAGISISPANTQFAIGHITCALNITTQPEDKLNQCLGNSIQFLVEASGEGTITYQWQKDGVNLSDGGDISGTQNDTLNINNTDGSDDGDYKCLISNECKTISSDEVHFSTDTQDPVISAPSDTTTHTSEDGTGDCLVNIAIENATFSDNCSGSSLSYEMHGATSGSGIGQVGTKAFSTGVTTIVYTVTDGLGRTSKDSTIVTVTDDEDPQFVQPNDTLINCNSGITPIVLGNVENTDASDNCTESVDLIVAYTDATTKTSTGACTDYSYVITRTWRVTDTCGNFTEKDQTITVQDTIKPTFTLPADTLINCNVSTLPANTKYPTAVSDVCDPSPQVSYSDASTKTNTGACTDYSFVITRTWRVTDTCGNYTEKDQTITVQDTIKPVFTLPADTLINCNVSSLPANTKYPAAVSDVCDPSPQVSYSDASTKTNTGACTDYSYVITRTWRVEDTCGNFTTKNQIITVQDTIKPVFTLPADTLINCNVSSLPANTKYPTAVSDVCDPSPQVSYSDVTTKTNTGACTDYNFTITRTWRVTDTCGNYTEKDQTITVQDTIKPVFTVPSDTTINCNVSALPANTGVPTAISDVCDPSPQVNFIDVSTKTNNGSCTDYNYIITRTWRVEDTCDNYTKKVQMITVQDTIKPLFTLPADTLINCNVSNLPANTKYPTAVSDVCDPSPQVSYSDASTKTNTGACTDYSYVITRTWRVTDTCGNYTEKNQTITVQDTIKPVFTLPADTLINCNVSSLPANTGVPASVSDQCDPSPQISYSDVSAKTNDGSCTDYSYVITRTWRVEDTCGNFTTKNQIITVQDTIKPMFTLPADTLINCNVSSLPANTKYPTAVSDVCDPSPQVSYSDVTTKTNTGACTDYNFTITRTWRVTDTCGNYTEKDQTITVQDTIKPVFTVPSDTTINCNVSALPANTGVPTAISDVCDPSPQVNFIDVSTKTNNGSCTDYNYIITRTWRVEDTCDNYTKKVQIITVQDTIKPVFTLPADTIINCNVSNLPANTKYPTAVSDVCDPSPQVSYSDASTKTNTGACTDYSFVITRTWRVTDTCGNYTEKDQTITVQDTIKPVFTLPADTLINCNVSSLPANTKYPTAVSDVCDPSPQVSYSDASTKTNTGACTDYSYVITRTWRVEDTCGNFTTKNQIITVQDTIKPVFTLPADTLINCNVSSLPANTKYPTAVSDVCDPSPQVSYSDVTTKINTGACTDYNFTITRTWRVTDTCGNYTEKDQTITVQDTIKPVFTVPSDTTINCNVSALPANTGVPTAISDVCDPSPQVNFIDVSTKTNNGSCTDYNYIITRTWRVEDTCDNYTKKVQMITVQDTIKPLFTLPADTLINCNVSNLPANTKYPTAVSDVCDPSPQVSYSDASTKTNTGACTDYSYVITRTWRVTDTCGNYTEKDQTITVQDTIKPVFTLPADTLINCNVSSLPANTKYPTAVSDVCDPSPQVSYSDVSAKTNDDSCTDYSYVITRTWRVEDTCGNFTTKNQIITVQDTIKPVFTLPADTLINCNVSSLPANTGVPASVSDQCDPSPQISYSDVSAKTNDGSCTDYSYVITRTWRVEDTCGNFTTKNQIITVQDTIKPMFTLPADTLINCNVSSLPANTKYPTAVSDVCDPSPQVSYSDVTTKTNTGACTDYNFTITRTWRVTDTCGNYTEKDQTITVQDTIKPVFTVPSDTTINCNVSALPANTGVPTAISDVCDPSPQVNFIDVSTKTNNGSCTDYNYIITRTWRVEDTCDNYTKKVQIITVQDTIKPVFTLPADTIINCNVSNLPANTKYPTAVSDVCDPSPQVSYSDASTKKNTGACTDYSFVITRTWRVTDTCGNYTEKDQTITVQDTIKPVFTLPADTLINCNVSSLPANTKYPAAVSDVCDPSPQVSYSDASTKTNTGACTDYSYVITRTWRVEDTCGNFTTKNQIITVQDTIKPVFTLPADTLINCNVSSLPANTGVPASVSDQCDPSPQISYSDVSAKTNDGSCTDYSYVITRTWRVEDTCGNFTTKNQIITVQDTIKPVFTLPADTLINCNVSSLPANTKYPTAVSDVCDPSPQVSYSDVTTKTNTGACTDYNFTITRTWRVTDTCGNYTEKDQTITVQDTIKPVFMLPADTLINCYVSNLPANTKYPTAVSDVCDPSPQVSYSDASTKTNTGACTDYSYVITRTWRVTDTCGNYTEKDQTITVQDTIKPVFTLPADTLINCNVSSLPANTKYPTAVSDVCDPTPQVSYSDVSTKTSSGACTDYSYVITRTWRVTDTCGNYTEKDQIITVQDTIKPTFTVPADTLINCNVSSLPTNTKYPTAVSDVCDPSPQVSYTDATTKTNNGSCSDYSYVITRTWKLTDTCGNYTEKIQTITVQDTIKPVFTVPADTIINCTQSIDPSNTGSIIDATDICDPLPVVTYTDASTQTNNGSCTDYSYTIVRTWKVEDICGNYTEKKQTIIVQDTLKPIFTVPANDTICRDSQCIYIIDPVTTGDVTDESDNCSVGLEATYSDDFNNLVSCDTAGYIIRTWTLLDKCGNSTSYDQIIWVEPTPTVILTPESDTICTNLHPEIVISSITHGLKPVKISYETQYNASYVEVIHNQSTFNLSPGFILTDTIINHSSVPQQVLFIIHPSIPCYCGVDCIGVADTVVIWVAPELKIIVDTISTYIGGKNIRCFGENNGFIHLKPEGGISAFSGYSDGDLNYSWNSGWKTTRDIQSIVAGTYNITVNDQLMCVDDSSFILEEPEVLSYFIKVVSPLSCAGNDGKLSGNIHGGMPGYSYLWTKVPDDYNLVVTPAAQDTLFSVMDGTYILSITDTNGCTHAPADTLIQQPSAIAILAIPDPVYGAYQIRCNGENSGRIVTINSDDDLPNVLYHWSGPGVDTSYSNCDKFNYLDQLYAGRYTLTYTDVFGCTGVQILDMNEPDSLLINQSTISLYPNGYNVTCYGRTDGSIQLNDISGGNEEPYQFNWESISGGSIGNPLLRDQTGLSAGIYAVTIEDAQNCSVSDTFTILQPERILTNPELSAAQTGPYQMNCFGDTDGFIKLHTTGGIPGYQYLWADNGSNDTERFDLFSGAYIVTVTDNSGCSITDTIDIRQPDNLIVDSVYVSNFTGFGVSCYNATDGVIFVKPEGGTGTYKYTWSSDTGMLPQDTGFIENLAAGTYQVEITDSNHCKTNFDTVIIQPAALQANIVGHNMNCTGSVLGTAEATIAGGTGQYDYLWSNGAITATISGLNPAEYILSVTDDNGCSISDTITIIQNTEVVLDVFIDKPITCNGMSDGILRAVASEGVPPYIYQWQDGPAADIYNGLIAGTYSVHVIDHEGCEGVNEKVFDDPDQLVADYIVNDALCYSSADGKVALDAIGGTGPYQFNWNGIMVTGNEVTGMVSGDYPLRISDEMGCFMDTVVHISQPEILRIKMDKDGTIPPFCPDWHNGVLSITVKGGTRDYSYTWDGEFSDIHDSVLTEVAEGSYKIHVIDAHNCKADTTVKLKALNGNCLEIPSAFTPDGNFINDNWEIRYMTEDGTEIRFNEIYPEGQISIYDRIGKVVYSCSGGCAEDWDGRDTQGRLVPVDTYYFIIKLKNGDGALKGIITIIR